MQMSLNQNTKLYLQNNFSYILYKQFSLYWTPLFVNDIDAVTIISRELLALSLFFVSWRANEPLSLKTRSTSAVTLIKHEQCVYSVEIKC